MDAMWTVLLQASAATAGEAPVLDTKTAFWMYVIGIAAVGIAWTVVPLAFIIRGQTDTLVDVLKQGTALRYITVTYIVLIVVTLALVGKLDSKDVSTLLAGIAGYVLGQSGRQREGSEAAHDTQHEKKHGLHKDDDVRPSAMREAG